MTAPAGAQRRDLRGLDLTNNDDVASTPGPVSNVQSGLRLDELLREMADGLAEVIATRGRMQGLLDAFLAVGAVEPRAAGTGVRG